MHKCTNMQLILSLLFLVGVEVVKGIKYENYSNIDEASMQLLEFVRDHPKPIGINTVSEGAAVEIRDTITLNTDIFTNEHLLESTTQLDKERVPERTVHAKGGGAWGVFEVTHDVSKYTKADVFNRIGKKTLAFGRFSTVAQNLGGNDLAREMKALAVKLYTKEGNLDLVTIHFPVYLYRDPIDFSNFVRAFKRNPRTNLFDFNSRWDFITKRPDTLHGILWLLSDYGIPKSYRNMDAFPIHTFEINNKHGDKYYVRFNFRTEQGLANFTSSEAQAIPDLDYYNRDLYNAIQLGQYPSWILEMDVMTEHDIKNVDYNPFEVTRLWKKGDYKTVIIGRLTLNKNTDNYFRDIEQSAFNPAHLVPGIPGPVDFMFKSRRLAYRDTQDYRLGKNHNRIEVNAPYYAKTYNRDGEPPINDNEKDKPNYYPNSYNGAVPYVDESRPKEKLVVLETNAVDLQPAADFYNEYVKDEAHRERLASNVVESFINVYPKIVDRVLRVMCFVDKDLGRRVKAGTEARRNAGVLASSKRDKYPPKLHTYSYKNL